MFFVLSVAAKSNMLILSLNFAQIAVPIAEYPVAIKSIDEPLLEDETDVDFVPHIDKLSVDTESSGNNVFTLASLVGEKENPRKVSSRGSKSIEDFINGRRAK